MENEYIDYIAQQAYEAGFEGSDSEELPKRLSDQLETGFEYVWLDNYRKGQDDAFRIVLAESPTWGWAKKKLDKHKFLTIRHLGGGRPAL